MAMSLKDCRSLEEAFQLLASGSVSPEAMVTEICWVEIERLRSLLIRYMAHIGDQEGTYFIGRSMAVSGMFTPEERAEFETLSRAADQVGRAPRVKP